MPGMVHAGSSSPLSAHSSLSRSSLSPTLHSFSSLTLSPFSPQHQPSPQSPCLHDLKSEDRGLWLIHLLLRCANSVASGHMEYTNHCLEQLSLLASVTGDPMQRVASYFMKGLATRITKAWSGLYKALNSTQLPSIADHLSAKQIFFNVCPYLKFSYTIANEAIFNAMEGEKVVHLIDLGSCEAVQWIALLQMFSSRQEGPPHLRITVLNEKKEVLDQMGQLLCEEAERLDIPFQFNHVFTKLEYLDAEMLKVKTGEAVGVSSVLQLHALLAEEERPGSQGRERSSPYSHRASPLQGKGTPFQLQKYVLDERGVKRGREDVYNAPGYGVTGGGDRTLGELFAKEKDDTVPGWQQGNGLYNPFMDPDQGGIPVLMQREESPFETTINYGAPVHKILGILRSLGPKIMVVVEQDSDHNSSILGKRFVEALHYYSAMFDSLESTLPQQSIERVTLENNLFGQEIQNIVACEGSERVERHEKLEKWRKRMEWVGFVPVSFCYSTSMKAKRMVLGYNSCEGHKVLEDGGCLTVCWQNTPLFSASAWQA